MEDNIGVAETTEQRVDRELMTYLKYPLPSKGLGKDLVVWWKDNERMFPLLGMVARRIMSV